MNVTYRKAVASRMQCLMAGWILARIHLAQDCIKLLFDEYRTPKAYVSKAGVSLILELQRAVLPWVRALACITCDAGLARIRSVTDADWERAIEATKKESGEEVVYFRMNLRNGSSYVGETASWVGRQTQHLQATVKHR